MTTANGGLPVSLEVIAAPDVQVPLLTDGVVVALLVTGIVTSVVVAILYNWATQAGHYQLNSVEKIAGAGLAIALLGIGLGIAATVHNNAKTAAINEWGTGDLSSGYPDIGLASAPSESGLVLLRSTKTDWAACINNAIDDQNWDTQCEVSVITTGQATKTYEVAYFDDHLHLVSGTGEVTPRSTDR